MDQITFTEREAIKKMLDYIYEERARLFNESMVLLDRLAVLDNIEKPQPDIEVIPPRHPLYEDTKEAFTTPCEWAHAEEEEQDVPSLNEILAKAEELKEIGEPWLIPKTEIEAQKDKDEKKRPVRTSSQRDVKTVSQYIKCILKDEGVPVKTSDLIEKLKETGINVSSPYVLLAQAIKYEPRIQKAKFGYYQYKW